MNFDNMVKIRKLRRVRGIPSLKKPDIGLCKNCQIGKMGKTSFKRKNYQSKNVWKLCILTSVDPLEWKVIMEKNSSFFLLMTVGVNKYLLFTLT